MDEIFHFYFVAFFDTICPLEEILSTIMERQSIDQIVATCLDQRSIRGAGAE